jgi:hypothetical protein
VNDALTDGDIPYLIVTEANSSDADYDGIDPDDVSVTNIELIPSIISFTPTIACYGSGTTIVITGRNFTGATAVKVNNINASFTVNSSTQVTATMPATATTGTISVITSLGTAISNSSLSVTYSPTAVAGTEIITCSNYGAVNITAGSSATNSSVVAWTSSGSGTFANASSLTTATYSPSAVDISNGSVILTLTAIGPPSCGNAISTKKLTITSLPMATIAYAGMPFCNSILGTQPVTSTGTTGGTYSAAPSGLTIDAGTGAVTPSTSTAGTYTVTYTMAVSGGCTEQTASCAVIIKPMPVIANKDLPACSGTAFTVSPTNGTDIVPSGTTYSWSAPTVTGNLSGGMPGNSASTITGTLINPTNEIQTATYTVVPSSGNCNGNSFIVTITVNQEGSWTGAIDTDWNNPLNWVCSQIPTLSTNVFIGSGKPNYPILSSGAVGTTNNLAIESGASLTVTGNTFQIAGAISNNGTFAATAGTIELRGSAQQTIGANIFTGNTILNLTINNPAGAILQGALNLTGIVRALNGNLNSGGYLTLLSTATQSALIDGSGSGNVLGNVNIQRYLSTAFGYKYISSPLQTATVSELAAEVDLSSAFPSFYKYDENNSIDTSGVIVYTSGWVKYNTAGSLMVPLTGYAANFGNNPTELTINMTGVVNNGNLQTILYNHNRTFTKGYNLVGNPYPSPVDWNAPGWTKNNIDNALYFFNASGTQYSGAYSSYVSGVSSGSDGNVIAAMQGFFVHVTDGADQVGAILGVTNSVRINNLNPIFKRAIIDTRAVLHFTANFETKDAINDAAVIYFDNAASPNFDKDMDALKMTNTDILVPNLYTLTPELTHLQINGMPYPSDSISNIPLGVTTFTDGWINLQANDINQLPPHLHLYLVDGETGIMQDLKQFPHYHIYLKSGEYNQRFSLVFSLSELADPKADPGKVFTLSIINNSLRVKTNLPYNTKGNMLVTNLLGQVLMSREVFGKETITINQNISSGVYIISIISGKIKHSEKILMRKDYE